MWLGVKTIREMISGQLSNRTHGSRRHFPKNIHEISGLGAGVVLLVDFLQALAGHVGVNLGGADVHMAKHHLNGA